MTIVIRTTVTNTFIVYPRGPAAQDNIKDRGEAENITISAIKHRIRCGNQWKTTKPPIEVQANCRKKCDADRNDPDTL